MATHKQGITAWHDLDANPGYRWRGKNEDRLSSEAALDRLQSHKILVPKTSFKLNLSRSSHVYAAGSCFARNIEDELIAAGVNMLSKITTASLSDQIGRRPNAFLNRYNTASLAQEFRSAFNSNIPLDSLIVRLGEDNAIDLSLCQLPYQPISVVKQLRGATSRSFASAAQADLLILTLGVNEVWRDRKTGSWLNITPPRQVVGAMPNRFEVLELSPQDNFNLIQEAVELVRQARNTCIPVVLTVSPVPLEATFFGECVISQTFKGKSILRSAAAMACDSIENVHYFPSYEAAMVSADSLTWDEDRRHPTSLFVSTVVREFLVRQGLRPASKTGLAQDGSTENDHDEIILLKRHIKRLNMEVSRLNYQLINRKD